MKRRNLSEMRFMLTELMVRARSAGLGVLHCTLRDYVICNNPELHVMVHYTVICRIHKIYSTREVIVVYITYINIYMIRLHHAHTHIGVNISLFAS